MATEHLNSDRRAETDRQLIARFIDGRDEEAFREMVRRYGPLVLGVCRRMLGEVHDAEDVFQATFLVLARDAEKIRKRSSLACWLHGVAYRIARKAAQRKARHMEQLLDDLSAGGQTVLDRISQRHDERMIDEELSKLPAKDRESLTLRYLEDRSNSDIAAALEISVTAVEGRLKRARHRLRRRLVMRGVSLSAFCGIVAATRVELQAVEPLISATVQLGMSDASGSLADLSYPHQLAATELGEMAIGVKSIVAVAAVAVLATGLGLYGLSGPAVGQDSASAGPVVVEGAAESPAPTVVEVLAPLQVGSAAGPQSPSGSASAATIARLEAAARISEALESQTQLEFNETPLAEVIDYLRTARQIPILIDRQALDDMGLGNETPITVSIAGISLRSALARVLDELELDYVISDEMLVITSKIEARTQLEPRIYSTVGLSIPEEKLIEIITGMVAPDTWEEIGGTGKITGLGDTMPGLVIAQTDQIHAQIAELLEKLRRAQIARDASGS